MQKRSLTLGGHRTSLALEPEFWDGLAALAARTGTSVPRTVAAIDRARGERSLASAVRLAVLARLPPAPAHEAPPSDETGPDAAG